ncbi:uncharacterized protein [Palaemon carinicauda]|uniref:uncharacterized protein isoform X2 n=1 Tax=Palaemon carinicauda TaxID=392227 RepID=UPI0035B69C69
MKNSHSKIFLFGVLINVWARATKVHGLDPSEVIADQPALSRNVVEIYEVYNSSGIHHIMKSSVDGQSYPFSQMIIKTLPSGCSAWFSGNYKWEKSELQVEATLNPDKLHISLSMLYLQSKLEDVLSFILQWTNNSALLDLPFMEMKYFYNFTSSVPQSLASSPSLSTVKNWQFWVNCKNSLERLKDFRSRLNGALLNITLCRDNGKHYETTEVMGYVGSEEKGYNLFNISYKLRNTSSGSQEEHFQMQFPLHLSLNLNMKTKTFANQSEKEILLNLTNTLNGEFMWVRGTDVSRHKMNIEDNSTTSGSLHCWERSNLLTLKEFDKGCPASREKGSLFAKVNKSRVKGNLFSEEPNLLDSRRIQKVSQTLGKTSAFLMTSDMTVDLTSSGHFIVLIHQKLNLSVCPALSFSLKQIFNISSNFSGWEYVLNQWHWGNIVVKGFWGQSFFELYKKTFSFSFDQDIPLPNIDVILDFDDYEKFFVKFVCPTLASSVGIITFVKFPVVTLEAFQEDEFWKEKSRLYFVNILYDQDKMTVSWNFNEERMIELYKGIMDVLYKAASHPEFCGNQLNWSLQKVLISLIGYDEAYFWQEINRLIQELQEVFNPAISLFGLQELWRLAQENLTKDSALGKLELQQWIWYAVKNLHLAEEKPGGNGIILHIQDCKLIFNCAKDIWKLIYVEEDPDSYMFGYDLPKCLQLIKKFFKQNFLQK